MIQVLSLSLRVLVGIVLFLTPMRGLQAQTAAPAGGSSVSPPGSTTDGGGKVSQAAEYQANLPWDYKPYRVLVWIAATDESGFPTEGDHAVLRAFLDRDFSALWRTDVMTAPPPMRVLAGRDFSALDYGMLTTEDPVIAIKRDHPNAAKIRFPADIQSNIGSILVIPAHAQEVRRRGEAVANPTLHETAGKFENIDGDFETLVARWQAKETEAILVPRGLTRGLEPRPKTVELKVADRMASLFDSYDKLFLVHVQSSFGSYAIQTREMDCLMRFAGPIIRGQCIAREDLPNAIGHTVRSAFAPVVLLEDAGTKTIQGRLRAGGLLMDDASPANVHIGDFLQPLMRRDDRSGEPTMISLLDWTYLRTTEKADTKLTLEIHSGRAGSLAGRRNAKTHRIALKIRPVHANTVLRLHAQGNAQQPLAGYDIYERPIDGKDFTLIGQTDWDGKLVIEKTSAPLRLLYVKNGLSILARLPMVPGQNVVESADLVGDDVRLQAESYIRGVQNSIIDLVAIRTLLASSIRRHLQQGDLPKAKELLEKLRSEPSYEKIANDMAQKQLVITSRNRSEQKKIDNMFGETRTLLVKFINPALLRELDAEVIKAGGGVEAPATPESSDATPANPPPSDTPAASPPAANP